MQKHRTLVDIHTTEHANNAILKIERASRILESYSYSGSVSEALRQVVRARAEINAASRALTSLMSSLEGDLADEDARRAS